MRLICACCVLAGTGGCHSAFIGATIVNNTSQPLELVELDYPSASFGTQDLAPGAHYDYRFKVSGTGATKLLWTDAHHQDHTAAGPKLSEGDEGALTVTFSAAGPVWTQKLTAGPDRMP